MIIVRLLSPERSWLVGSHQSLLGYRSRHCHGINFTNWPYDVSPTPPVGPGMRWTPNVHGERIIGACQSQLFPNGMSMGDLHAVLARHVLRV